MENNKAIFMARIGHAEMTTGVKVDVDLNDLRGEFGDNFNTLFITNTDTSDDLEIYLDGTNVKHITANNGVFSFDWEAGLTYNFLSLENVGGGTIIADAVKITVGRTGGI